MTGGGAWLPRTYLYVATFIGLVTLLTGIVDLIDVLGRMAMGTEPEFVDPSAARWWEYPLTSAMTGIIVGGGIWLGHAWYAGRLVRDPGWRGDSERPARLRMAYFVAVILATAAGTLYQLGEGVGAAISAVAGAATQESAAAAIVLPSSAPFRSRSRGGSTGAMRAEALASGDEDRVDTEARLELYPMAVVGLGFAAVGAAWLIGALVDTLFGGGRVLSGSDFVRDQVARYAPFAVLGVVLWIWAWGGSRHASRPIRRARPRRRRGGDPAHRPRRLGDRRRHRRRRDALPPVRQRLRRRAGWEPDLGAQPSHRDPPRRQRGGRLPRDPAASRPVAARRGRAG